jgi:4-carboxymuconolactone decarboxylase
MNPASRLPPLAPPYSPEIDALLTRMTPPGAPEVLALFRTLAHNPALSERMMATGGYLLSRKASLPLRDREIVINRTCVRCGAQYEWGVHVAAFSEAAGLTEAQTAAITEPNADDSSLTARDRLLVRLADELHETATIGDGLWSELAAQWTPAQLIELLMLAGWYRAISYVCNATQVPLEPWAARWQRNPLAA